MFEYAYKLSFIPDSDYNSPELQHLMFLANKAVLIHNDYYSFEKEYKEQNYVIEKMSFNAVGYYVMHHKLSIDEALKRCLDLNIEVETELNLMSNEFLNDCSKSDVLKAFVRALRLFVGGSCRVHTLLKRYNNV